MQRIHSTVPHSVKIFLMSVKVRLKSMRMLFKTKLYEAHRMHKMLRFCHNRMRSTRRKILVIFLIFLVMYCADISNVNLGSSQDDFESDFFVRLTGPLSPDDEPLLKHVYERLLTKPSTEPYRLEINKTSMAAITYNQYRTTHISWMFLNKEIRLLYPLGAKPNGFFVEAGAYDGEFNSNTLYLEWELGWTGVLIEPDKQLFRTVLSKKRRTWSCQCCLSSHPYPYETIFSSITSADAESGSKLFSSVVGSKDELLRTNRGYAVYDTVQCLPLQTILWALNREHVDLISLDIEDMEDQVLEHFPMSKISVDVWLVEHRHPFNIFQTKDKEDPEFIQWFEEKGYILYKTGDNTPLDYIFIKRNSTYFEMNRKRLSLTIPLTT